MTAASFWSLLAPAVDMASDPASYGHLTWIPVGVGFLLDAGFVCAADELLPESLESERERIKESDLLGDVIGRQRNSSSNNILLDIEDFAHMDVQIVSDSENSQTVKRRHQQSSASSNNFSPSEEKQKKASLSWRRIFLLVFAITVHNIPEGLAVGVGFGAVDPKKPSSFESARNLAVGIGIQNFPEGLAVSLPLHAAGVPAFRSFWWGQLSGMVEPFAGILGCLLVSLARPLLPYALAFAAGAMIFVVVDSIIPESSNSRLTSVSCIAGFLVMMALDVGLG